MVQQSSTDPTCAKPAIRILLYTDDPNGITDGDEQFGLGPMKRHLLAHKPFFADVCIEWVSRFSRDGIPAKKLDDLLKDKDKKYDEVWFFGTFQATRKKFISKAVRGGPESELNKTEVEVVGEWMAVGPDQHMRGGGVLMTGDHNQTLVKGTLPSGENPLCPESDETPKFLGLGRAIGRCVPRAGRLRRWEGEPATNEPKHSFNTQVPSGDFDIESQILQLDANPQKLLLLGFDFKGEDVTNGFPHPLFFYRVGSLIRSFPDHVHEGAVVLPTDNELKDEKEWPKIIIQPKPRVVARGIDSRTCSSINLLAAYNGDCVGVGRIVADSTWHHYVGVNLEEFPSPSLPNTPTDQIGQFYENLAIWLAPRRKRFDMACVMFEWLANHVVMIEEIGGDPMNIGRAAYAALAQVASPCEISELLDATVPDYMRKLYESIYFPDSNLTLSPFPSKTLLLGCIVNSFHQAQIEKANAEEKYEEPSSEELIAIGFKNALVLHAKHIQPIGSEANRNAYLETPSSNKPKNQER